MTEGRLPPEKQVNLKALLLKEAVWTFRLFRLKYPEIEAELYQADWESFFWIKNYPADRFQGLKEEFDLRIKPAANAITMTSSKPATGVRVHGNGDPQADYWLDGMPMNVSNFSKLLSLSAPSMPMGGLDFKHAADAWVFKSASELNDTEKRIVISAKEMLGLNGPMVFEVTVPKQPKSTVKAKQEDDLNLSPAAYLRGHGAKLKQLVERDEDRWRNFIANRAELPSSQRRSNRSPQGFGCLFDLAGDGDIQLSELLTLYDRVDIIPDRHQPLWLGRLGIGRPDLQELVSMGRLRLVLPFSAEKYLMPELLDAVSEADPDALILSRQLATRTIENGQVKHPFLYASLTTGQRIDLLSALIGIPAGDHWQQFLMHHSDIFQRQHHHFMFRGALATFGCGIGAFLGDLIHGQKGIDARIELSTTGAAIEWASALGSTFLPRDIAGFDESHNANIVASFLNREAARIPHAFGNRMQTVVDGLLAVSGMPPMDVARNFKSVQVNRFRDVANKLLSSEASSEELQREVVVLNEQVKRFKSRTSQLRKWHVDYVAGAAVEGLLDAAVDNYVPPVASFAAKWFFRVALSRLPDKHKNTLEELIPRLIGYTAGVSVEAVIVSRSKDAFRNTD